MLPAEFMATLGMFPAVANGQNRSDGGRRASGSNFRAVVLISRIIRLRARNVRESDESSAVAQGRSFSRRADTDRNVPSNPKTAVRNRDFCP